MLCEWQQGKKSLQECFCGLTVVSKALAYGMWTEKEDGHNKLKSELYFHKPLSFGHREFHAKYLLLTGH